MKIIIQTKGSKPIEKEGVINAYIDLTNLQNKSPYLNNKTELFKMRHTIFYIGTYYKENFLDGKRYKSIYVSRKGEKPIRLCLTNLEVYDDTLIEKVKEVYSIAQRKLKIKDAIDEAYTYKRVYTPILPSTYDALSYQLEEVKDGVFLFSGEFALYKLYEKFWRVSGHKRTFFEEGSDSVNLEKIEKMDSLEFHNYFEDLDREDL